MKFKFGGREFILFVLKKKKKLPMIRLWLKFLIIFRNHSYCLSPVVNSLLDLIQFDMIINHWAYLEKFYVNFVNLDGLYLF